VVENPESSRTFEFEVNEDASIACQMSSRPVSHRMNGSRFADQMNVPDSRAGQGASLRNVGVRNVFGDKDVARFSEPNALEDDRFR